MLFNAKKVHDYDEKQTVINSHQERKRQQLKEKRERSEDFLHTNLVPRKKENKNERESKRA